MTYRAAEAQEEFRVQQKANFWLTFSDLGPASKKQNVLPPSQRLNPTSSPSNSNSSAHYHDEGEDNDCSIIKSCFTNAVRMKVMPVMIYLNCTRTLNERELESQPHTLPRCGLSLVRMLELSFLLKVCPADGLLALGAAEVGEGK